MGILAVPKYSAPFLVLALIGGLLILLFAGREEKHIRSLRQGRRRIVRSIRLYRRYCFIPAHIRNGSCYGRYGRGFQPAGRNAAGAGPAL